MPRVAVVGAGTMGAGIAQVALQFGWEAIIFDADPRASQEATRRIAAGLSSAVERGKLTDRERQDAEARLIVAARIEDLPGAALLVEAISESLQEKRALLARLDALFPADAVLATNTSSLSITAIAGATRRPQRIVGMHFFNPVPAMKLVEVIPGRLTAPETIEAAISAARSLGKTPIRAANSPGFIVNRVGAPFYGEAFRLLAEGVAEPETVDALIAGMGFRMGPFELLDLVGLDVSLAVSKAMYEATFGEARFRPHPLLAEMVDAGLLGRKSGRGFYEHPPR